MPMDCPSSTGNGMLPKSSTTWWVSFSKPASVQLKLPTTVASVGLLGGNRLVYGWAADQGGTVAPYWAERKAWDPGSTDAAGARGGASAEGAAASAASASDKSSGGSSSQVSCSSIVYARARGMVRQLSMEPVGQGEMQAMQPLHTSARTT